MRIKNFIYFLLPVFFISCIAKAPVITSIDPKIGRMGEMVTLTGSNFGASREESYVTIAGVSPTSSSYLLWQDNQIIVRIPELGESGLIYIHSKGKRSNGVLFSNIATVPRPADGDRLGLEPRISSIDPQSGVPGSLITITGSNFGTSRENASVFFTWDFEASFNPYAVREPEYIEVSEIELGYDSWNAREIRVRLPDGASSGNIEVRTPHGTSRPVYFDVTGVPGTKVFKDKRIYLVDYSIDVRVTDASRPNALYLWVPRPVSSPSQRNVNLISRNMEPFVENHRGVSLYKLDNLLAGTSQSINHSFHVEVYAVESMVRQASVTRYERNPFFVMYTQSTNLIPASDQRIRTIVNSIISREQNPYARARLLYDWIISNMYISTSLAVDTDIAAALERRRADTYSAALLFTAMARAAGIPCIPVAGVLIDRNGQTIRHYWTEFWIDSFGWIPVDPSMGKGLLLDSIQTNLTELYPRDAANFYFGSMDNQRIAFSRGEPILSQMENRGRTVLRKQSFSLQNIWEEAVGGLESYSSLWGDIVITGVYAQ